MNIYEWKDENIWNNRKIPSRREHSVFVLLLPYVRSVLYFPLGSIQRVYSKTVHFHLINMEILKKEGLHKQCYCRDNKRMNQTKSVGVLKSNFPLPNVLHFFNRV